MATQTIKMVIQFRRDTTANWLLNKDVIPAAGEPCFDLDAKTLKIGDGETTYEHLPVIGGSGISIEADGKSIVLEDGIIKLAGFDTAAVGAQPRKNAEGEIEWVIPSIDAEITTLQEKVSVLENDVDFLHGILIPDEEGAQSLEERVAVLETDIDKIEGSIQSTVTSEVTAQINDFASKISEDEKVNTFKELVDYVANHDGEVVTMVADITNLQSLVGSESVQDQIKYALDTSGFIKEDALTQIKSIKVNGTLMEIVDGVVDITVPEATVGVKGSDEIKVAEDGTLSIGTISMDKIVQPEGYTFVLDGGCSV